MTIDCKSGGLGGGRCFRAGAKAIFGGDLRSGGFGGGSCADTSCCGSDGEIVSGGDISGHGTEYGSSSGGRSALNGATTLFNGEFRFGGFGGYNGVKCGCEG